MMLKNKKVSIQMFEALHGLRGVAAFCVVIRHTRDVTNIDFVPGGFLAVDLFFLLSGFVICHAYEDKLRRDLNFIDFVKLRILRLYPLYIIALILGALYAFAKLAKFGRHDQIFTFPQLISQFSAGIFFLPSPSAWAHITISQQALFPMNGPAWSLFFELVINFVYGALIYRFSRNGLLMAIVLSLFLLVWSYAMAGTPDGGSTWATFFVGIPRVSFSFLVGVYLRRYHTNHMPTGQQSPGRLVLLSLFLIVVSISFPATNGTRAIITALAIIVLVFPVVLMVASRIELVGFWRLVSHQAGEASYAIYVIHLPLLLWIFPIFRILFHANRHPLAFAIGYATGITAFGMILARYYDAPVRRWIRQKLMHPAAIAFGTAREIGSHT